MLYEQKVSFWIIVGDLERKKVIFLLTSIGAFNICENVQVTYPISVRIRPNCQSTNLYRIINNEKDM